MKSKIYIIGLIGVNACGKSTLSKKLIRNFPGGEITSTDTLVAINRMINPHDVRLDHSSYSSWERYGLPTKENIIRGFNDYRMANRNYIECVIDRSLEQNIDMIFEGLHIEPEHFKQFEGYAKVRFFTLKIEDEQIHKKRIKEKCESINPLILNRFEKYFPQIRVIQYYLIEESKKYDYPVIEVGKSINETLIELEEYL